MLGCSLGEVLASVWVVTLPAGSEVRERPQPGRSKPHPANLRIPRCRYVPVRGRTQRHPPHLTAPATAPRGLCVGFLATPGLGANACVTRITEVQAPAPHFSEMGRTDRWRAEGPTALKRLIPGRREREPEVRDFPGFAKNGVFPNDYDRPQHATSSNPRSKTVPLRHPPRLWSRSKADGSP